MIDLTKCKPVEGNPQKPDYLVTVVVDSAHVGERYSAVLRRFKTCYRVAWKRWDRSQRRLAVAMVVVQHDRNRDLYRAVVTGVFS